MTEITDEMVAVFRKAAWVRQMHEDGCPAGHGIGADLQAVAPLIGDAEKLRAAKSGEIFTLGKVNELVAASRKKALEEAACIAEDIAVGGNGVYQTREDIAAAIRALAFKPEESK
jgi:hypothetical protein